MEPVKRKSFKNLEERLSIFLMHYLLIKELFNPPSQSAFNSFSHFIYFFETIKLNENGEVHTLISRAFPPDWSVRWRDDIDHAMGLLSRDIP